MVDHYCKRCGRKLHDKVSISRGYGSTCFEKIQSHPDLIYLLEFGSPEESEYEKYHSLLQKQIEKRLAN
ncbi:DUF6011 domain-containing protein [Desertibacillus haloalkaliphilus]|uniref:DUF6011 domain-containing protein n=1 Tax=Desertibacillus haloalkaliphilus TaxID=1328930 RepID=UPI001C2698E1|nr:DUF6011 domain-containing protein [Desertibacillus haloalkaliphilus]MBU8908539.1 hypothetical protein [Desertibacillus haloalkaliphilus]